MRLFFIHSRLQLAIASRIASADDIFICHRGLEVPELQTKAFKFQSFVLAETRKFSLLIKIIKDNKVKEVFFPHSHPLNAFLVCLAIASPKTKIKYLEDGATTIRFLLQKGRAEQFWRVPTNLTTRFALSLGLMLAPQSPRLLRYVLNRLAKEIPVSQYLNLNSSCIPIYTSANLGDSRAVFVDITPRRGAIDARYDPHWAFFLSPRYLRDDDGMELVDRLAEMLGDEPVLLILHPTFWKSEKGAKLNAFYGLLERRRINYDIYDGSIPEEDVTFSLYLLGCRKFIFIDTSAELTMVAYESYFEKARLLKTQVGPYSGEEITTLAENLRRSIKKSG